MTKSKTGDPVVLSYFDCLIRESDLKILRSSSWLNDAIIGFYFTFLEKERFKYHSNILFVGPEVSQCLKESPSSEVQLFLDPLEAKDKDIIFMAVNDSGKSAGGSHWSLLVYSGQGKQFYHLDSSSQSNLDSALKLANNLKDYLCIAPQICFEELASLQQNNSFDCGVYMLCNVENLAENVVLNKRVFTQVPFLQIDTVANKREKIIDLIMEFKTKQD